MNHALYSQMEADYLTNEEIHELADKAFWSEAEKALPDYKICVKWLKEEGSNIMRRQR